jgi:hypothetical protein
LSSTKKKRKKKTGLTKNEKKVSLKYAVENARFVLKGEKNTRVLPYPVL